MRISDWSSDVCSSDLLQRHSGARSAYPRARAAEGREWRPGGARLPGGALRRLCPAEAADEAGDGVALVRAVPCALPWRWRGVLLCTPRTWRRGPGSGSLERRGACPTCPSDRERAELMSLWIIVAAVTALTAVLLTAPLLRRRRSAVPPAGAPDLAVYRAQLVELNDQVATGLISGTGATAARAEIERSEEHTSELQSQMRTSYAFFCLKKKKHHS